MTKNVYFSQNVHKKPIGSRIFQNYEFLKKFAGTKSERKRKKFLKGATNDEVLSILEICVNVLRGNFPLSTKVKLRIQPHAAYIRQIARRRTEQSAKKHIQKGSGIVSSLIIPILAEVARQLIIKKNG